MKVGIDIGSTTIKFVVLDDAKKLFTKNIRDTFWSQVILKRRKILKKVS